MKYLSVCSGIEAATAAWHPLGWQPVAFAEVDKFPSAVLAHHYPDVPNWGDMTKFQEWPDAVVDVLVGGTPCQSFSIAGLRKGLADPRGNLALVYLGIADKYRPQWVVWENVPGVLSSWSDDPDSAPQDDGDGYEIVTQRNDFDCFLAGLAELGYGVAWRVLDAQYFGLAQRRKRVFVVGCLGDWRRAAAVLFEPESLRGDPPPRREAGKRTAPTLSARTRSGGGLGTDFDCDGGLVPLNAVNGVSHAIAAARGGSKALDATMETYVAAFGGNNTAGPIDVATACRAKGGSGHGDFETETFVMQAGAVRDNPNSGPDGVGVQRDIAYTLEARAEVQMVAHALRADGFDASEDGTGRGTPIVPVVCPTLRAGGNATGGDRPPGTDVDTVESLIPVQGVALRGREGGATAELTGDVMTALRCGGGGGDKPHVLMAFDETQITSVENRCNPQPGDPSHPLASGARPPTIAFSAKDHGADAMDDLSPCLRAGGHNESHANAGVMPAVTVGWRVRRLTPRECERLQGFPDDFTAIPYGNGVRPEKITADWIKYVSRGNPKQLTREDVARLAADGPRYKALGNSMAVPVMRWIGEGIAAVSKMRRVA